MIVKISFIQRNISDRLKIWLKMYREKKKYRSPARKNIYETFSLSKEQKQDIDNLYQLNYGKKIPYLWHRHYSAFTGTFDAAYFPELLYEPQFEYFENLWPQYCAVFADKNVINVLASKAGIKTPKTLVSSTKGMLRDDNNFMISREEALSILHNAGSLFAKPSVNSGNGRGCIIIEAKNGMDSVSKKSVENILDSMGDDFVIQERLVSHKSISDIYSGSVNTFRVITYRWKNDIETVPSIMRIGHNGAFLDNAHAGGMFIAVDDDGTLHKKAFTEFKTEYTQHPDSGVIFDGYRIFGFDRVLKAAKRMHMMVPQIGIINWDFAIDEEGNPVLIEANTKGGSIWLSQMAHDRGPFGAKTAEILRWIRFMNNKKRSERYKYAFGKME